PHFAAGLASVLAAPESVHDEPSVQQAALFFEPPSSHAQPESAATRATAAVTPSLTRAFFIACSLFSRRLSAGPPESTTDRRGAEPKANGPPVVPAGRRIHGMDR